MCMNKTKFRVQQYVFPDLLLSCSAFLEISDEFVWISRPSSYISLTLESASLTKLIKLFDFLLGENFSVVIIIFSTNCPSDLLLVAVKLLNQFIRPQNSSSFLRLRFVPCVVNVNICPDVDQIPFLASWSFILKCLVSFNILVTFIDSPIYFAQDWYFVLAWITYLTSA